MRRALIAATNPLTITEPAGAEIYFKDYGNVEGEWELAGRVPLKDVRVPQGQLRWKMVKTGFDSAEGSSAIGPSITIRPSGETPAGMVFVRGGPISVASAVVRLPDFWMDRYEVTNQDFKRFLDAGGYHDAKYWKEPFLVKGVQRSFADTVAGFKDKTGRPGPAAWELGTFAEGRRIIQCPA